MNTRASAAAARRTVLRRGPGWPALTPSLLTLGVAAILLVLGLANIVIRATWHEADDGVLWVNRVEGVTAFEVAAGTPAARAGIRPGDLLEAIDGQLVDRSSDVWGPPAPVEGRAAGRRTGCCGSGPPRPSASASRRCRSATPASTSCWRRSGCSRCWWARRVRLRRPNHPATLHFLWLAGAFFGWAVFSFSGRLDRLDWFFYWADAAAVLLLPPLFLHFTFFFPERPRHVGDDAARQPGVAAGLPAGAAARRGPRRGHRCGRCRTRASTSTAVVQTLDRFEPLYLSIFLCAGLVVIDAGVRRGADGHGRGGSCGGSRGARRSGGCRSRSATRCRTRWGSTPSLPMELSAVPLSLIPLTFASRDRALPPGRRRGDRQARHGVGRGAGGRRGDLRGAAAAGRLDVPRRTRASTPRSSRCWPRWWSCWSRGRSRT